MRIISAVLFFFISTQLYANDTLEVKRTELIYGYKDGMGLLMVMQAPVKYNGKAIISLVSGNWKSGVDMAQKFEDKDRIFVNSGYTVFEVVTSSQPRYAIPDEVEDVKRAVRFVRYNAATFGIDPAKIGITGLSSGGHLSLMVATADDEMNKNSRDPIDRVSSRVQAAAVFYPPTDFLNYGQKGFNPQLMQTMLIATGLAAAFDFKRWNDTTRTFVTITDLDARLAIAKKYSPIYAVSADDPPVLIIHGDADRLVPMQQSESIIEKFEEVHVPNKLIIKKGGGHGWRDTQEDDKNFVDWFDKYLK